jgi:hypothetical protein
LLHNRAKIGSASRNPKAITLVDAAVAEQLIAIILPAANFAQIQEKYLFDNARSFDTQRGKLMARLTNPERDGGIGEPLIRCRCGLRSDGKPLSGSPTPAARASRLIFCHPGSRHSPRRQRTPRVSVALTRSRTCRIAES